MSIPVVMIRRLAARAALLLVALLSTGANAAPDGEDWAVAGGEVVLELNRGVLDPLGIDAGFVRADSVARSEHPLGYDRGRFEMLTLQQIAFRAPGGAIEAFTGGYLQVHGGLMLRVGETELDATDFRIEPHPERPDEFRLLDRAGIPWARLDHGHFELVDDDARLEIRYANLSMTPALAALAGNDSLAGQVFGVAHLSAQVVRTGDTVGARGADQCSNPNWPTDPGFTADIALTDMARHSGDPAVSMLRCQDCDGTGGGPMVVTPNAELVNEGTADVPWWRQFTGPLPPYGNDQHPYLVWNMYRLSADGRFEQIGASGTKHAFFSVNSGCPCSGGNVLWTGCGDIYSASSNDFDNFLAPRGEIIPVTGQWGRCFSLFDADCDGSQDGGSDDPFDNRMNVFESDLVEPGARYFVDAWYVVRDDVDIFNTMGWREVEPTWNPTTEGGIWTFPVVGDYAQGRALDAWVDPVASDRRAVVETPDGTVSIAVRASDIGNGSWRYDYAVANHDFMRTTTAGAEPDLQVVSNAGLAAFELPLVAGTTVSTTTSARADRTTGQEWAAVTEPNAVRWTDPGDTPLDWATTFRFSIVTDTAPARTTIRLIPAGETTPIVTGLLGPEPAELLFANDFEPPATR
ncbi:MAG: hypothetical protein ACNS61_16800 [Candidatus Wenzhouxiangella sp. M2_3B_020]